MSATVRGLPATPTERAAAGPRSSAGVSTGFARSVVSTLPKEGPRIRWRGRRSSARGKGAGERRALAAEYGAEPRISEERIDPAEVASIVMEAAVARNGWKVILARCAPTTKPRSALQLAREMIALAVLPGRQPSAAGVGQSIPLQPATRAIGNCERNPSFVHRGLDIVLPERGAVLDPKGLPERIGSLVSVHEQKQEAQDWVARLGRRLGR